ncbi:hypothetical protein B0I37DRAFT_131894 [Chaetomium sp. MPI-CAGE-AT-0009]|nr:hypothetical protein B0I37DRAFT_131894 [Chaetomium sp. MPI-CAGE-AT-0009]
MYPPRVRPVEWYEARRSVRHISGLDSCMAACKQPGDSVGTSGYGTRTYKYLSSSTDGVSMDPNTDWRHSITRPCTSIPHTIEYFLPTYLRPPYNDLRQTLVTAYLLKVPNFAKHQLSTVTPGSCRPDTTTPGSRPGHLHSLLMRSNPMGTEIRGYLRLGLRMPGVLVMGEDACRTCGPFMTSKGAPYMPSMDGFIGDSIPAGHSGPTRWRPALESVKNNYPYVEIVQPQVWMHSVPRYIHTTPPLTGDGITA